MASRVLSGGIANLTRLGHMAVDGALYQTSERQWMHDDNGNPADMLELTRNLLRDSSKPGQDVVFTIERNLNRNVCHYTFNPESGKVEPGWLMVPPDVDLEDMSIDDVEEQLSEEDLNIIERKAYGIDMMSPTKFSLRALKGEVFTLRPDKEGNQRATLHLDGDTWTLCRILIQTKPNAFKFPAVHELHMEVCDAQDCTAVFYFAV